jgi:hypothetical protein
MEVLISQHPAYRKPTNVPSRRHRHGTLFWPGVISVAYLVLTLVVTAAEYLSELSKLSRGFYTDTFSPFAYTHLLSFPVSAVHSDWPGYPETFDQSQWRAIVQHAVGPVVTTVVLEAVLIAAVAWLVVLLRRRGQTRSFPTGVSG